MKESRSKYLFKNTAIFIIGSIATKFIAFFLVPLYTNVLSTSQYGTVDLVYTICTVLAPVLILNIHEGVMRFGLDQDANHKKIMSIGILVYLFSILAGLFIFVINPHIQSTQLYSKYIYFYTITYAGSALLLCYLRGKEELVLFTIGSILQSFSLALLNIIFLLGFHLGIKGYFLAYILSSLITMIYGFIAGKVWEVLQCFHIDSSLFYQMAKYSIVLIPNTFMWWIINSSDRLMVSSMIGVAANGIYAVSYKLPSLVSAFTGIFNQAWSYSAIREMNANDEEEYNNQVFKQLTSFTMLVGIGLLVISKPFLRVYVESSYYSAWKYTSFLIVGSVFITLATFMSTSYTVHKDSLGFLLTGCVGAISNVILNLILIPTIGIYGAATATLSSYLLVFIFSYFHTRKYIHYNIRNQYFIYGTIALSLSFGLMYLNTIYAYLLQGIILLYSLWFYKESYLPIIIHFLHKYKGA